MRKISFILLLLLLTPMLTGCWVYGRGETYGYITTIEDAIFWDKIHIRAELESSQTDCYVIDKANSNLQGQLRLTILNKQRVKLTFKRHIGTLSSGCYDDEAINVEVIK